MAAVEILRIPEWSFPWLRHGFSTRQGGESEVYGQKSLNLGWTKEDDPAVVAENRRSFVSSVVGSEEAAAAGTLVTVRQIHSGEVRVIRAEDGAPAGRLQTADGKAVLEGDGLVTNVPDVLIAVGTADCVPVLVVDPEHRAVGAFHAGWRGTAAAIAERGIATMREVYGSHPGKLMAAVGPSIGACCYTVGEEVRTQFRERFAWADEVFRETAAEGGTSELRVDLWEANRRQLLDAGLAPQQIAIVGECTGCTRVDGSRRYFSHRAEQGRTGRMLSAIGVFE